MPIGGFPLRAFVEPKNHIGISSPKPKVKCPKRRVPQVISLMRQVVLLFESNKSFSRANKRGLITGIDGIIT